MSSLFVAIFAFVASSFRTRAALQAEILALPKKRAASFALPALRPTLMGLALAVVARLAPWSAHRSPLYSYCLAP
jgi:hypothetical protein